MLEDNIDGALGRLNRPALGNLTNRPLKRKISSVLSDSGAKSRKDGGSRYPKHVRQQVETIVQENGARTCGKVGYTAETDCCRASSREAETALSHVPKEYVLCDLLNDGGHPDVQDDKLKVIESEALDVVVPKFSISVAEPNCPDDNKKDYPLIFPNDADNEEAIHHVVMNDEKDIALGEIGSSNHGSTELLTLPTPEGFKSLALERCSGLKADNCANVETCDDLLKACSCSFCLKASYIWSDLHYQDIKGRISAIKKSQKDASILAQKCSREKESYHDPGNFSKSKLEFELCGQWMSLFRHMEDAFAQEGSQLQTSFVALKELREECKTNLEMLNGMSMEKH